MPAPDHSILLRSMDLNYWEMFREFTPFGRRAEIVETYGLTALVHPDGNAFDKVAGSATRRR